MQVFITGGGGFIGSLITEKLISEGYKVVGVARSEASVARLQKLGASVIEGSTRDHDKIKQAILESDGVMHLAFDLIDFESAMKDNRSFVEFVGELYEGTNKFLITTAGLGGLIGTILTVASEFNYAPPAIKEVERISSVDDEKYYTADHINKVWGPALKLFESRLEDELLTRKLASKGVRGMGIRLAPTVHDKGDQAFIAIISQTSQKLGFVPIYGDGLTAWCAVSREDAADLYILAMKKGRAGDVYHAVGEQGVSHRDIGRALADKYELPVKYIRPGTDYLPGFIGFLWLSNVIVSAYYTKDTLGWSPKGPTLLENIRLHY